MMDIGLGLLAVEGLLGGAGGSIPSGAPVLAVEALVETPSVGRTVLVELAVDAAVLGLLTGSIGSAKSGMLDVALRARVETPSLAAARCAAFLAATALPAVPFFFPFFLSLICSFRSSPAVRLTVLA
jgi:hypothetical protein